MELEGCGDHSCMFGHPSTGMGTNGGCRCLEGLRPTSERHRVRANVARLRKHNVELEGVRVRLMDERRIQTMLVVTTERMHREKVDELESKLRSIAVQTWKDPDGYPRAKCLVCNASCGGCALRHNDGCMMGGG